MPPNTVKVDRTTRWGNPFLVSRAVATGRYRVGATVAGRFVGVPTAEDAVECFRIWLIDEAPLHLAAARTELRGKNLACWCAPGRPCHADVLLQLVNQVCP